MRHRASIFAFLLAFLSVSLFAGPTPQPQSSPLDTLEVLRGPVEAQTEGGWVTLTVGDEAEAKYRIFRIEADSSLPILPVSFQTEAGEIFFWGNHLVVLIPAQGRGWHFSVPGIDELMKGRPGLRPSAEGVSALLARYEVTRIEAAQLASFAGPKALRPERPAGLGSATLRFEPDNQEPGGTGVGTCAGSCSITCRDESSCITTCGPNRCAFCTCPLSCTCK